MSDMEKFIENFTTAVDFQEKMEIAPATALANLPEWDSLAALGVIIMFDTEYGLTAGFYSMDENEINRFFDSIEAGVTYVNRRAGATTGAWSNIQAFGGWKASGTSGTGGGGPWYLLQYLREQSRTRVR